MIKRTLFSITILLFATNIFAVNSISDTSYTAGLIAFDWTPISDVEKISQKDLSSRGKKMLAKAEIAYIKAYKLMKKKEYEAAIKEFKAAIKLYKKAKLNDDALNFIHANMALSYASTGKKEDLPVSKIFLDLITSKAYANHKWVYNIAIAHDKVGNTNKAASLLSSIIRKDKFHFQAYVTLEAIYRNSGNETGANKVVARMQTAENKLIKESKKPVKIGKETIKTIKTKENKKIREENYVAKQPKITNLKIVTKDDHLQFNKNKINARSMIQIQKGIADYNLGIKALLKKDYKTAQKHLKKTEKSLKKGKITADGLNFSRGNLVFSYLAEDRKKGSGKAKRYLKYITPKLYKTREWTYNMAVVYYTSAVAKQPRRIKGKKLRQRINGEHLNTAIKLFKNSIKLDKVYLPAYENLIYIYRNYKESNGKWEENYTTDINDKKASRMYYVFEKARDELMKSFSKQEQIDKGHEPPYVFRINLGTFGEFDTPSALFEEDYLITVPEENTTERNPRSDTIISIMKTTYLAGLFYTLDEARAYQKAKQKEGYTACFIVAFKEGEKRNDF